MEKLSLNSFFDAADDFEKSQLQLRKIFNYYAQQFRYNRLYPFLSELLETKKLLDFILRKNIDLRLLFQQYNRDSIFIKSWNNYDYIPDLKWEINLLFNIIDWSYPQIQELIREGKVIYNFVKQNLLIEHIGKDSKSKNDGIFFINNDMNNTIQVYYFRVPFLWGGINSSVLMKVKLIHNYPADKVKKESFENIKNNIPKEYSYVFKTNLFKVKCDLDFPFEESILPVAKRRIMKIITG